jgi:magnesium transporter
MIRAYVVENDRLIESVPGEQEPLPPGTVWIDLLEPGPGEDKHLEALIGVPIPTREEMLEIEESSRFYTEHGAMYLTAPVLHASDTGSPGIAPISFVLTRNHLVTVRYTSPQPFSLYKTMAMKPGNSLVSDACNPLIILFGLMEAIIDRLADVLENVAQRLDAESARLIGGRGRKPMSTPDFRSGLRMIGREGDFLSRVRESLAGLTRLLHYVQINGVVEKGKVQPQKAWLKSLERDLDSLSAHVGFLSERTIFLLDTVVGLVSVEQNGIIKIFSVAAVVFMPPTLVASIYGMNFHHMPELEWLLGYPYAIGLMVVSALVPLLFFRSKGWL